MIRRTFLAALGLAPVSALATSTGGKFNYPYKEKEGPEPTPLIPFQVGYTFGDGIQPCPVKVYRVDADKGEASFQIEHKLTRRRVILGCWVKDFNGKLISVAPMASAALRRGNSVRLTIIIDLKTNAILEHPTRKQCDDNACLEFGQMI